jgi:hypothetical protein
MTKRLSDPAADTPTGSTKETFAQKAASAMILFIPMTG